ncbi:MAG TPA: hypothetical protein VGC42_12570 [Kofleriaceae bacterium]
MPASDAPSNSITLHTDKQFNGVKVFSATMFADRERLGETVTEWMTRRSDLTITQMVVTQSSDAAFHCVTITVFYWEPPSKR